LGFATLLGRDGPAGLSACAHPTHVCNGFATCTPGTATLQILLTRETNGPDARSGRFGPRRPSHGSSSPGSSGGFDRAAEEIISV